MTSAESRSSTTENDSKNANLPAPPSVNNDAIEDANNTVNSELINKRANIAANISANIHKSINDHGD